MNLTMETIAHSTSLQQPTMTLIPRSNCTRNGKAEHLHLQRHRQCISCCNDSNFQTRHLRLPQFQLHLFLLLRYPWCRTLLARVLIILTTHIPTSLNNFTIINTLISMDGITSINIITHSITVRRENLSLGVLHHNLLHRRPLPHHPSNHYCTRISLPFQLVMLTNDLRDLILQPDPQLDRLLLLRHVLHPLLQKHNCATVIQLRPEAPQVEGMFTIIISTTNNGHQCLHITCFLRLRIPLIFTITLIIKIFNRK